MKTVAVTTTSSLAACVKRAAAEPSIVVDAGKPIAAVVPLRYADRETVALATNPDFIAVIERSRARHQAQGGLTADEVRQQLGLPLRKRRRAARQRRGRA